MSIRKPLIYIFCCIIALFLSACSPNIPDEPEKENAGQVLSPSEQTDTHAEPVHTHKAEGIWSADSETHWQFCSCGKRTEVGKHDLGEEDICSECKYQISSEGSKKSVSLLNEFGDEISTSIYVSGSLIKTQSFSYEYDNAGKITQTETYENDAPVSQTSFDTNGSKAFETLYSAPGYSNFQLFTSFADGYSILLPKGYEADTSLSEFATIFTNENTQIEIYKQSLSAIDSSSYRNFSNRFLRNKVDHVTDLRGTKYLGGKNVYISAWHRNTLEKIENDKNHYLSIDISHGNNIYTIFIKSSVPVNYTDYGYMVESLDFFSPTAEHTLWTSKAVVAESRGWNEETKAFYNKYFNEDAPLTWGFFDPESAYGDTTEVEEYEKLLDYKFPVILTYMALQDHSYPKLKDTLEGSWANGNVLELTLQTYETTDGGNMVYDILSGEYDGILEFYARTIKNFGHPVLFRLMNEMNGDWCPYSAYHTARDTLIYKEAYRYVYSFFEKAGADNVIWIWNPNESSFPEFDWNSALMYYPGDEYVDIVGMTAYNTGNFYVSYGEKWQSFSALYDDLYAEYCARFSQPLMITEFSCAKKGGDKTAWVEDMFDHIESYDRIKLAVWWNHVDYYASTDRIARNYLIDDPVSVLEVFKNRIK